MNRKIIHSFPNSTRMERVLNKVAEYESCMWSWDIKPSDRNPYGIANDEYLCIDEDKLTIWSNYKQ